jgi:hypothetical protein
MRWASALCGLQATRYPAKRGILMIVYLGLLGFKSASEVIAGAVFYGD